MNQPWATATRALAPDSATGRTAIAVGRRLARTLSSSEGSRRNAADAVALDRVRAGQRAQVARSHAAAGEVAEVGVSDHAGTSPGAAVSGPP